MTMMETRKVEEIDIIGLDGNRLTEIVSEDDQKQYFCLSVFDEHAIFIVFSFSRDVCLFLSWKSV